ncbi:hypothetical protein D9758_001358 [Tetrapyrgos nigripes]|uniref:Uncharacterized protein n=1 Tax=Tetrapyrgos nigripes TaxID=182062 RepID=A0A8H5GRQ5_9AGAR|nr:hypothetical protein D9758_001358 [Tetrapyrgos nigripes]
MKSIRKSLNGHKDSLRNQISTPVPLPAVSRPAATAVTPPQKVIRATADYRPQAPQELSFKKGDFFYVLKDVDNQGSWYEAHNPVTGARGLVPRAMFEEFNKSSAATRHSKAIGSPLPPTSPPLDPVTPRAPKTQVFYAIVMHDFDAERADELDAKRGDAVTVVAQSNREWFVAKPIGRLGRPGLIPVSFVEIHDPTTGKVITDIEALMDKGDLPKVEDWKRAMFNYKQNSIALGVIDSPNRDMVPNSPYAQQAPLPPIRDSSAGGQPFDMPPQSPQSSADEMLPEGILLSAEAVSFHFEMDDYWFRLNAIFQPYSPPGQDGLPHAKHLVLFRVYNDFYDFQVALLKAFPREAGREPPAQRMLPYMPGPAENVNDELTASRREELDTYLHELCELGRSGLKNILEHEVVREFLSLKPGDAANDIPARYADLDAVFAAASMEDDTLAGTEYGEDTRDQLGKLKLDEERSEGSEYGEDEGYAGSPQRRTHEQERHPYARTDSRPSEDNLRLYAHSQNHHRSESTSSFHQPFQQRASSPYSTHSRSQSPCDRGLSPQPLNYTQSQSSHRSAGSHNASSPSISSTRSHAHTQSTSGRARSQSNANTPPISAANPQTAFVKIKIFDKNADDLIAIRVHPLVTHAELMDKVQARLGDEVENLRYRDSVDGSYVYLETDAQLKSWIDETDKHVLYAQ